MRATRKPNRLLTLQFGDTAKEQVVFLAYGAPDGERDNMISVLKLVTNLMKCNKLNVEVKGLTDTSKERLAEAMATFNSVDDASTLVTLDELTQFTEVH